VFKGEECEGEGGRDGVTLWAQTVVRQGDKGSPGSSILVGYSWNDQRATPEVPRASLGCGIRSVYLSVLQVATCAHPVTFCPPDKRFGACGRTLCALPVHVCVPQLQVETDCVFRHMPVHCTHTHTECLFFDCVCRSCSTRSNVHTNSHCVHTG